MEKKQLLIEQSSISFKVDKTSLTESLKQEVNGLGNLVVKGVPCTILDEENANGRIYSTEEMKDSLERAREFIESRSALCQAHDHPEKSSYIKPIEASHVVLRAYIENVQGKSVLMNDWEILPTENGNNLRKLIESRVNLGTSIRGEGFMQGSNVTEYDYLGTDVVGNPSSGTYTLMFDRPVIVECASSNLVESSYKENKMDTKQNLKEAAEIAPNSVPASNPKSDVSVLNDEDKYIAKNTQEGDSNAVGYKPEVAGSGETDPKAPNTNQADVKTITNLPDTLNVLTRKNEDLSRQNSEMMKIINNHNNETAALQEQINSLTNLLQESLNRLKAYKQEFGESTMEGLKKEQEEFQATCIADKDNALKAQEIKLVDKCTDLVAEILSECKDKYTKVKNKLDDCEKINEAIVEQFKASRKINHILHEKLVEIHNANRKGRVIESAIVKLRRGK